MVIRGDCPLALLHCVGAVAIHPSPRARLTGALREHSRAKASLHHASCRRDDSQTRKRLKLSEARTFPVAGALPTLRHLATHTIQIGASLFSRSCVRPRQLQDEYDARNVVEEQRNPTSSTIQQSLPRQDQSRVKHILEGSEG